MAAIDSSIYSQIQPLQIESPVNALAKVATLKNAQNQNRLFDMKVAESERTLSSENALNDAYRGATGADGSIDRNKLYSSLAQSGQGAKLPGIQKGFSDQDKSSKEADLANLKAAREKQGIIAQVAGAAKDQESWLRGKAQLQQMGVDVSQVPDQFDPRIAATLVQQSLTGVQQLDKAFKEKEFSYRQQNDAANRGVTMRGQNMTDARGRESNDINRQLVGQKRELEIGKLQDEKRTRDMSKQATMDKAKESLAVIDKALKHPGRETATGKSGVLDPRNYSPGTDATDFQVVLDQLGGQAFLQAFESLKGGGQITEIEGKKATDAMARLNRKQSDAEFKRSLQELRTVVEKGIERAGGTPSQPSNIDSLLDKYK